MKKETPDLPSQIFEINSARFSPLPKAADGNVRSRFTVTGVPPSRSDEFESYKKAKGVEMSRVLNDNKNTLKDKKKQAKTFAEQVNCTKDIIDDVKSKIDDKRRERILNGGDVVNSNIIMDEEEYSLLNSLKQLKGQYKDQYDGLRRVRSDIDYCNKLVDQCRHRLMAEFESWYEATYGPQIADQELNGSFTEVRWCSLNE